MIIRYYNFFGRQIHYCYSYKYRKKVLRYNPFCAVSNSSNLSETVYIDWIITERPKIIKIIIWSCLVFAPPPYKLYLRPYNTKKLTKQTNVGCQMTTDTDHWPEISKIKTNFSNISNNYCLISNCYQYKTLSRDIKKVLHKKERKI